MASKNLPRIKITAELDEALDTFIEAQGIPPSKAEVVRAALADYLSRNGYEVTAVHPKRGGDRT